MERITFKDYMKSKSTLYEAINQTPKHTALYTIRKYCKIPIGESKETKKYVSLKPKQKITVAWLYEDELNPTPLSITFPEENDEQPTLWKGSKLLSWLIHNANEDTAFPR